MSSGTFVVNIGGIADKLAGVDPGVSLDAILKPSSGRTVEQLAEDESLLWQSTCRDYPYTVRDHGSACGEPDVRPYVLWIEQNVWFAARPDAMASFGAGLCPEDAMQNCRLRLIKEKMDRDAEMTAMGY